MLLATGSAILYVCLFITLYFQVFMLVSFIEARKRRIIVEEADANVSDESLLPLVAIVVPCFNEERTVGATIESLLALDYPNNKLEIIVVDDGSTDDTYLTAMGYATDPRLVGNYKSALVSNGPSVHIFHKENGGKHTAMNYALLRTHADLIGCLDADSVVASTALQKIIPLFGDKRIAAVTPGILIKRPSTALQHMQDTEYSLSVFNRFTLASLGSAFITPGPFSIFRTAVVREAGGWNHGHYTEDMEMALRIQEKGYLIANAPAATVYTGTPSTLRALIRQRVRWTYGFIHNSIDYRHMFGSGKYGNLGILILPMSLISIGLAIFFFLRVIYYVVQGIVNVFERYEFLGFSLHLSLDPFYINTSALLIIIYTAITLILVLIALGAGLGTGKPRLPAGTPLFVVFYSLLVPMWLSIAVMRALFKTGVKWR